MPNPPNNACYVGHPNWPSCLNELEKPQIKQIVLYELQQGNLTEASLRELAQNTSLSLATRQKIDEIEEEIF